MQDSQYKSVKILGQGNYGTIYLVRDVKDGSQWVQKQIDINRTSECQKDNIFKEFRIPQQLQHPNIIKFRDVYITTQGILCIIMEYAEKKDLSQIIKSQNGKQFTEDQILDWFTQICLALKHVHDKKILHRNMNLQNIYITKNNRIKLGGFGIAKVLQHTFDFAKTQIGTPYYLSPEIIESKPYSFPNDIWALGILLYELCMLEPPFLVENGFGLYDKICKGVYKNISSNYSSDLNNIIRSLLKKNPNNRPKINKILESPLITNRIKKFLNQKTEQNEFSHSTLHNQTINTESNMNNIRQQDDQLRLQNTNQQQQNNSNTPEQKRNTTPKQIRQTPEQKRLTPEKIILTSIRIENKKYKQQHQTTSNSSREVSNTPQKNQIQSKNYIQYKQLTPSINPIIKGIDKPNQYQSNNQTPKIQMSQLDGQNPKKANQYVSLPALIQKPHLIPSQRLQQPQQLDKGKDAQRDNKFEQSQDKILTIMNYIYEELEKLEKRILPAELHKFVSLGESQQNQQSFKVYSKRAPLLKKIIIQDHDEKLKHYKL